MKYHRIQNPGVRLVSKVVEANNVAAAENASACPEKTGCSGLSGRGGSSLCLLASLFLAMTTDPQQGLAQVRTLYPGKNKTQIINGIPLVQISAPNAVGASTTFYTSHNVDKNGMVYNNVTIKQGVANSALLGTVGPNPNLTSNAASLIISQVVSTRESDLAGMTEVVGQAADVMVVNPNGITCRGCGFINTPRVTLTTGRPEFAANGAVSHINVQGGNVLFSGAGYRSA